jgi:hypothetical protein
MSNLNIVSTSPNTAAAQQTDLVNALVTAVQAVPVTPPVVTVVPLAAASTTYTYAVIAKLGTQTVPATATITTGAATLSAAASNTISWNTIPNAVYDVYRVTGGANQGKIASNISGVTLNAYGGVQSAPPTLSLVDSGLAGDSTIAPTFNTSGFLNHGIIEPVQVISATSGTIASVSGTVILTAATAGAYTLGAPIAGPASQGGQDGSELLLISVNSAAHTVTTPANAVVGGKHIITFSTTGSLANTQLSLVAAGGVWYIANAVNAATLS